MYTVMNAVVFRPHYAVIMWREVVLRPSEVIMTWAQVALCRHYAVMRNRGVVCPMEVMMVCYLRRRQ